jgi:hypothetical protein
MFHVRSADRCTALLVFIAAFSPLASAQTASLPNAPSVVEYRRAGTMADGQLYRKPTAREDLRAYEHDLIGPRAFIAAAIRSGIEQIRPVPIGWGQDFPGYAQRYGSAYGEEAIDSSVRFGLAGVLHEDVRYLLCHGCSAKAKIENAFLSEFTARHGEDGHRSISLTPVVADFSGPIVAYSAWYPPGYETGDAAKHATFIVGTRIAFHIVREFLADRHPKAAQP